MSSLVHHLKAIALRIASFRRLDSFGVYAKRFGRRLQNWKATPAWNKSVPAGEALRFGILLTPWLGTAVPFFALECGAALKQSGHRPVILFDATNVMENAPEAEHAQVLRSLVTKFYPTEDVYLAARTSPLPLANDLERAEPIFRENAIWRARGENAAAAYMEEHGAARTRIAEHLAIVRGVLSEAKVDRLLIPGGIFGLSALYVALARELGIEFCTFDGTNGLLRLAQMGVAAHLADIPRTAGILENELVAQEREQVIQSAQSELDNRFNRRDHRQFQLCPATGRRDLAYDLLVPLNIRWDSAALGRQRAFPNVAEWLEAILNWVAAHPSLSVCIRQHPRERLAFAKGTDDLAPLVAKFSFLKERLRFVPSDEALNTYDLLQMARVVLPHTSTIGIEAALLGVPVVLSAACYYEDLGFCSKAQNPDQYFALIQEALDGALAITPAQKEKAALLYHLTQRCTLVQTSFTAVPEDFCQWVEASPDELWSRPEVADFLSALISGEPLALIRHRRLIHAN